MNRIHRWYCKSDHWKRTVTDGILPWTLEGIDLGESVLEIGPGPGVTTDWLRQRVRGLECLEIDSTLADALQLRLSGCNVTVRRGDATVMPYTEHCFTSVVSFTMLHHIPTPELQDQLFRETYRVLRPGGIFVGVDSLSSLTMRLFHIRDTLTLVAPDTLAQRLASAGFRDAQVNTSSGRFKFSARRPLDASTRMARSRSPQLATGISEAQRLGTRSSTMDQQDHSL